MVYLLYSILLPSVKGDPFYKIIPQHLSIVYGQYIEVKLYLDITVIIGNKVYAFNTKYS